MSLSKSEVFDFLYAEGEEAFRNADPCNIRPDASPTGVRCNHPHYPVCCEGCKHLGPNGCTVKALACKLWLCFFMKSRHSGLEARLQVLRTAAQNAGIRLTCRAPKDECI